MSSSRLKTIGEPWETAPEYQQACHFDSERFLEVTDLLLENPNLNSTHLFRADILYDDANLLMTVEQKETQCGLGSVRGKAAKSHQAEPLYMPTTLPGTRLKRKVLRRLIPRKPQLDHPLDQWCCIYEPAQISDTFDHVVIYVPQIDNETDMPWYHPPVKSLAFLYEHTDQVTKLSVHFLGFSESSQVLPSRLHRTFISLLQTFLRLAKNSSPKPSVGGEQTPSTGICLAPSALKDTILPQHTVQDTYTRLKQQYAKDLISRWVEKTEPAKHVFEDLSIAAFLIELWKQMYKPGAFPGFVDIACGNGVLTYILIKEGYKGRGFDARRRSTWSALDMDDYLDEMVCIPQPFLDNAPAELLRKTGIKIHNGLFNGGFNGLMSGLFKPGTFMISNHADELTPWTSILATLSSPDSPLPFLAIPCCSHALSGARHRYTPKDIASTATKLNDGDDQSASGDLRALRVAKVKAANHQDDKSTYACLTRKVLALAQESGCETELTLMRIPSTRNIGIVGNRKRTFAKANTTPESVLANLNLGVSGESVKMDRIERLLLRECAMSGGMAEAAKHWIEGAHKLQKGQGKGKVNLRGKAQGSEQ